MGVDPGTVRMGLGIIETGNNSYRLVKHSVLRLSSKDSVCSRLGLIFDCVKKHITEFDIDAVAVEDIFVSVNPRSALKLGQARGAVIAAAYHMNVDVFEYTPTEVKKAVSTFGRADKYQVSQMVEILLGVRNIKPHDVTDALAVSICHINTLPLRNRICEL
ncbi:MAG: crossover junction endodeoxyribonuclease RuvC [Oligoflexia bacterium]|nr:crossover junction endodeoxyribonuclease RuvC [Oligoflexia bacterium]